MKPLRIVIGIAWLIGVLALLASAAGLFWHHDGSPYVFTTLRGQSAEIYGRGLYRFDTLFAGAGNMGTDVVTLVLGLPLLASATWLYTRGSLRGALLLLGTLSWFLYVYASYALGAVAYNELFLVYVGLLAASLYAFGLLFTAIGADTLREHMSAHMPRRGPAGLLFASGMVLLMVWLSEPVMALVQVAVPARLDSYTTLFTHALDLAVITPAVFLAAVLILRRDPLGYLLAFALLMLESLLAPMIAVQTILQLRAGVTYPPGQIAGPIGGFAGVALLAIWVLVSLLRHVVEPSAMPMRSETAERADAQRGARSTPARDHPR